MFKTYILIILIIISLLFSSSNFFQISLLNLEVLADSNTTRGVTVLTDVDSLPYIKTGATVHEVSSYDRTGGNNDGSGYYLYQNSKTGGYVVLEENRPGAIFRIWETAGKIEGRIKIYFDGEENPRIDEDQQEFFSGKKAPFLSPLMGNPDVSSGGYYSYYPLAFAKSIRVEYTVVPSYYQITYHLYDDASGVTTYTGKEDLSKVYTVWNNPWQDPKSQTGNKIFSSNLNLNKGEAKTVVEFSGPGSVRSIKLRFPQFNQSSAASSQSLSEVSSGEQITDDGKAFTGSSSFTVNIDPRNVGVVLLRRFDYSVANQTAAVLVDDQYVSTWINPGSNDRDRWKDSGFDIPFSFTKGKDKIKVKIVYSNSSIDWNEFHYWVRSSLVTGSTITDEVDVGNNASELSHNYLTEGLTWSGIRTFTYPPPSQITPTPPTITPPSATPTPVPEHGTTDDGKAFKGSSNFTVKLAPQNLGVSLTRRLDYWIGDQTGDVYVDGALVGRWQTPGKDQANRWRDETFSIPASFTQGKDKINVKIQFISSEVDWNEFYYWVKSLLPSGYELSDEIDIGKSDSETAHNYTVDNLNWSGTVSATYPANPTPTPVPTDNPTPTSLPTPAPTATPSQAEVARDILSNTRVQIYWDDQTSPSVDMPLGFFFGVGSSGEAAVKGLFFGVDPANHTYYNFFPMPYGKNAKIILVNSSSSNITDANLEVQYNSKAYNGLGTEAGYFTAIYNKQDPSITGQEYTLTNLTGKGHIVGTIVNISQMKNTLEILEGDHKVFIDSEDQTPKLQGTGTEDFFNGGYFFRNGAFTLPLHGNPIKDQYYKNTIVMYRLSPYDSFIFNSKIKFNLEHGYSNDLNGKYESGIFAYLAKGVGVPTPLPTQTPVPTPTSTPKATPTPSSTSKPTPVPKPSKHIITGQIIGTILGVTMPAINFGITTQNIKTKQIFKTKTGFNGTFSFNLPDGNYLVKPTISKWATFSPSQTIIKLSGKNISNILFNYSIIATQKHKLF